MKKIAVILFNLGGPDTLDAVQPFLSNLFNDVAIIRLPTYLRRLVAYLIVRKRLKAAQAIYAQIGGGSPLLENTQNQAKALEKSLADLGWVRCFIAMRYWHPFAEDVVLEVKKFVPDEIVLLPLYPQFSTTTTGSSFLSWAEAADALRLVAPTRRVCCYPDEEGFLHALATSARDAYEAAAPFGRPRFLFSAHGLPEKIIEEGDPYQWQCEHTAAALADVMQIGKEDWVLCYQSRVGPMTWIGPSTDAEIVRGGRDKVPLVVVPIAFVSEHSETLVEIDIEYRHLAERSGVPFFAYAPAVGTAPSFIQGLGELVKKALDYEGDCLSVDGGRLCPAALSQCCQAQR